MYPNEARLRNMTYGVTIHYDVEVEFDNVVYEEGVGQKEGEKAEGEKERGEGEGTRSTETKDKTVTITLPQILLGKFPIMVHSNLCILSGLPKDVIYNLGEDKNDHGGYFIIDGKEKIIVSQEIFADNKVNLFPNSHYPIIYITGGNQGSHAINSVIEKNLTNLLKKYLIIH